MNDHKPSPFIKEFKENPVAESSSLKRARELVLTYGWNSTSYQILNPGIRHWFSEKGEGVVGFVSCNGVRVVAGAPVCAKENLKKVAAEFETDAALAKEKVCYFCAEERLEVLYKDSARYSKVLLGAQPVWRPSDWESITTKHKSLRAQLNRARNKGVTVSEWSAEKACNHPQLLDCLRRWLSAKGLPPLHFLVEPETLSNLSDRRVFVAERAGEAEGFVLLSPVSRRDGWLFEQFVHCPGAPNGCVELMIDAAMRALANDGYEYATLGLSPLSARARVAPFRNPLWLRVALAWMRKHARRFYNFDGLDAFKAKLQPKRWEPVFAVSNEPRLSPKTLYAIASAFSENKPIRLILSGLWRALLTELKWFGLGVERKLLK
jgi:phosphatidylglycerol lysyltransferase